MTMTRNAIGNLINRYKAVLQKCNLMNTFGSLAVAAMLVMGGAGVAAGATTIDNQDKWNSWIGSTPTDAANVTNCWVEAKSNGNANSQNVTLTATTNGNAMLTISHDVSNVASTTLTGVANSYQAALYIMPDAIWESGTTNVGVNSIINLQDGTHKGNVVLDDATATVVFLGGKITGNLNVNAGSVKNNSQINGVVTGNTTLNGGIIEFNKAVVGATGSVSNTDTFYTNELEINGGTLTANSIKIHSNTVTVTGGSIGLLSNIEFSGDGEFKTSVDLSLNTSITTTSIGEGIVTVDSCTVEANSIENLKKVSATNNGKVEAAGHITAGTIEAKNGGVVNATANIQATTAIQGGDAGNGLVKAGGTLDAPISAGAAGTLTVQSAQAMKAGTVSNATGKDGDIVLITTNGAPMTIASINMSNADGKLNATSAGAMSVTGTVKAGKGDISLVSNAADAGGTSAIKLNGNVTGGGGKFTIKADNGSIDATGKAINGGAGAVSLTAGGDIGTGNITGGSGGVTLSAAQKVTTAAITSGTSGSGDVSATGKSVETGAVTLKGGDVTLHATGGATTDSVTVGAVTATAGAGNFSATADNGVVSLAGINMAAGTGKATVTAKGNVTTSADIAGGAGGIEITSTGGDIDAAGKNITAHTGKVTLSAVTGEIEARNITTKTLSVNAQTMKVNGELNLTGEGTDSSTINADMDLAGVKANVKDLVVDGKADMRGMVAGSQFRKLKVTDQTTFDNNSEIAIGDFNPGKAVTIGRLGSPVDKTIVNVQNFTDGTNANTLSQAVTVYEGATLGYGAADMQALKSSLALAAAHGAPMNGGVYAAVRTLNLDGGSVNVGNQAKIVTRGDANFGEGATLAVDQSALGGNPVFTKSAGSATVAFAENSNVVVTNAQAGDLVIADGGFAAGSAIDKVNVHTDTDMLTGSLIAKSSQAVVSMSKIVVPITVRSASDLFPGLDKELCALIDGMYADRKYDVDSSAGGVKFLSRATDNRFLGKNKSGAAKTIEGAARMISIAGVPQMAMAASNAAAGAIVSRTSIGDLNSSILAINSKGEQVSSAAQKGANAGDEMTGLSAGNGYDKSGLAMWIMPLWQSTNNFGMKAGNFDMDMSGNLGGIALGVDYTFEQAIRAGISFNIGGGYAKGSGDFASTENNMNFWGLGAYVSGAWNNFGVTADVNYTSTFNDIRQDLNDDLRMGSTLKSEVYASALTAGLRGEYKFRTDVLDIMPHIGVRYMYLHTDEYDVKAGGDKIYKGDAINQHIWTFPVGVQFNKDIALDNGWYVKPSLDMNITPAAGDVKSKNDIKFTGVNGSASMETQIMDYFTYGAQAGLEFGNDNLKLGLNYSLQAGAHTTNHGVFGTFRYEF